MRTAAVVTVTNGKRMEELKKCYQSIRNQSYRVSSHYILCDGSKEYYDIIDSAFPMAKVCYWAEPIGGDGWAGQRW